MGAGWCVDNVIVNGSCFSHCCLYCVRLHDDEVLVVLSDLEVRPHVLGRRAVLPRKVREQKRVVLCAGGRQSAVRPALRGCAPVQRPAASRARSSAARFSASLTGSQAPYAASSDSSAEISALSAPRRARSAARVSWGAQRLRAGGGGGGVRSRAARAALRRSRRGRPRAARRSRPARPARLRAGSGPRRGAYIDGECGGGGAG
jgi:hypothetical protein